MIGSIIQTCQFSSSRFDRSTVMDVGRGVVF